MTRSSTSDITRFYRDDEEFINETDWTREEVDEFFDDLCGVIDDHADTVDDKAALLCIMLHFRESWLNTYYITDGLWEQEQGE